MDENLPVALKRLLAGHDVETVHSMGWLGLANGKLLGAAEEAGSQAFMTSDKGIARQNRMPGRRIAVVELSTNHWPTIESSVALILDSLDNVIAAEFIEISLPRPARRRTAIDGRMPD